MFRARGFCELKSAIFKVGEEGQIRGFKPEDRLSRLLQIHSVMVQKAMN